MFVLWCLVNDPPPQSDQGELKYLNPEAEQLDDLTSIGPGGIEIACESAQRVQPQSPQSDQEELKSTNSTNTWPASPHLNRTKRN